MDFNRKINCLNDLGGGVLTDNPNARLSCSASRCLFKSLVLLLFFILGLSASAKARQTYSVISENAHQLVDVCRIEVIFGVANPTGASSFSFGLVVNDTLTGTNTLVVNIALANQTFSSISRENNEYTNLASFNYPVTVDGLEEPYPITLWLNLPHDFDKTIRLGIGLVGSFAFTEASYSIAKDCPKGN